MSAPPPRNLQEPVNGDAAFQRFEALAKRVVTTPPRHKPRQKPSRKKKRQLA